MNILDWIVIGIIVFSGVRAYYKGFLYTGFQTLSTLGALVLSYIVYKPINVILRKTFVYDWLQKTVAGQLANGQEAIGIQAQTSLINAAQLPIPDSIKEHLIRQNNPEVYRLLGVENFTEYVGGYIANFLLNVIAFIIVWCVVKAVLYILGESIQIIAKLPIINFADKWLGLGLGIIKGILGIWIMTLVLAIFIPLPKFQEVAILLNQSTIAKWFYENNLVLAFIDQLFI